MWHTYLMGGGGNYAIMSKKTHSQAENLWNMQYGRLFFEQTPVAVPNLKRTLAIFGGTARFSSSLPLLLLHQQRLLCHRLTTARIIWFRMQP